MSGETASIADMLAQRVKESPERCAVKVPRGRLPDGAVRYEERSFGELGRDIEAAARHLKSQGVRPAMRVLIAVPPGPELFQTVYGLLRIGAVPVVLDPGLGWKHLLACVRRTAPEALIAGPLTRAASRLLQPWAPSLRLRLSPEKKRFGPRAPSPLPAFPADDSALAAILFTSGSTGPPKGVCYGRGIFAAQARMLRECYRIEPGETDLPLLPVFALFNPALGVTTVFPEINPRRPATVEPSKIVQAIFQCGVTSSFGAPALWERIGRYCLANAIKLPGLRRILMAGAPVPPGLIRMFEEILPNGDIHTPYGATECLPVASVSGKEILGETEDLTRQGKGTCVGLPLPGIEVKIIRAKDDVIEKFDPAFELPRGETGEIIVKGPIVTSRYDGLEEATRRAKIRDAGGGLWHRMGDLGYFGEHGRLWFCGRKAERVETASGPLYTDCCEAVFNRHPHVFRSALVALGTPGRQTPAIVIEPEKGCFPKTAAARRHFELELRALARQNEMTRNIRRFFFRRHFPVDVRHNTKIHRLTLARLYKRKNRIPPRSRKQ